MDARGRNRVGSNDDRCETIRTRLLILFIPLAFFVSVIAARVLLFYAPPSIAVDLAQPVVVVTAWGAFGITAWCALALPLIAAAIVQLRLLREDLTIHTIVGASVLAMIFAACAPWVFSSDIYGYAAYGDLARVGIDPYVHGAALLAQPDAIMTTANWQWRPALPVCVYGPAFVSLASVVVLGFHALGTLATLDAFRALACAALIACTLLAYHLYPGDAKDRATAAMLIGLNPVAIWSAAEGHNDAIMLAAILGGWLIARRAPLVGTFVAGLAFLIKAPAILAPLFMVYASTERARLRRALGAVAGIAVAFALSIHELRDALLEHGQHAPYAPHASLQAVLLYCAHGAGRFAVPLTVFATAAIVISIGLIALRALRSGEIGGYGYLALAAWCANPVPFPWYGVWLLPIAAIAPHLRSSRLLLAVVAIGLIRYLPDAATFL